MDESSIYVFDAKNQQEIVSSKPWLKDPYYFKAVRISSLALVKMVNHAHSGGNIEVMGLMQGKVIDREIYVMDSFALPVEGTETRVNAHAEAYEFMVEYMRVAKLSGRLEHVIGWYHSHPGYGCWLSGIDVATQDLNQKYQEPFCAVVIDPTRTLSTGKVDIGAFRTFPENYTPSVTASENDHQSIPLHKVEDFGVHSNRYYSLEVSCFKSSKDSILVDQLWQKYWTNTLSTSPLKLNAEYIGHQLSDVTAKVDHVTSSALPTEMPGSSADSAIHQCSKDSSRLANELIQGLVMHTIKECTFQ